MSTTRFLEYLFIHQQTRDLAAQLAWVRVEHASRRDRVAGR
jgi:hypothetical protein